MVRIPQITSVDTAIRLYYEKTILRNPDIVELFGKMSRPTILKLKKLARIEMDKRKSPVWNDQAVNTSAAYASWGLDISDLERRYEKLKKHQ